MFALIGQGLVEVLKATRNASTGAQNPVRWLPPNVRSHALCGSIEADPHPKGLQSYRAVHRLAHSHYLVQVSFGDRQARDVSEGRDRRVPFVGLVQQDLLAEAAVLRYD